MVKQILLIILAIILLSQPIPVVAFLGFTLLSIAILGPLFGNGNLPQAQSPNLVQQDSETMGVRHETLEQAQHQTIDYASLLNASVARGGVKGSSFSLPADSPGMDLITKTVRSFTYNFLVGVAFFFVLLVCISLRVVVVDKSALTIAYLQDYVYVVVIVLSAFILFSFPLGVFFHQIFYAGTPLKKHFPLQFSKLDIATEHLEEIERGYGAFINFEQYYGKTPRKPKVDLKFLRNPIFPFKYAFFRTKNFSEVLGDVDHNWALFNTLYDDLVTSSKYRYAKLTAEFKQSSYAFYGALRIAVVFGWLGYLLYEGARANAEYISGSDFVIVIICTFFIWYAILIVISDLYYSAVDETMAIKKNLIVNSIRDLQHEGINSLSARFSREQASQ